MKTTEIVGRRFIAFAIDRMVMSVLAIPSLVFVLDGLNGYSFWTGGAERLDMYLFYSLIFGALPMGYYLFKDALFGGASIGKKMVKLRLVKTETNARLTAGQSFVRNGIVLLVCLVLPVVGLVANALAVVFTARHVSLGDIWYGTCLTEE